MPRDRALQHFGERDRAFAKRISVEHERAVQQKARSVTALRASPLLPLVVEEATATTVVAPDCSARLDEFDNLIVALGGDNRAR